MHFFPFIKRPDGHYRHVASTMALSAASALVIGLLVLSLPEGFWRFGVSPDRLLKSIEVAGNPVLWFTFLSNLALLATFALWIKPLHGWIVKDASRMEVTGAAVLGTLIGFLVVQEIDGLESALWSATSTVLMYLAISATTRWFGPEDALSGDKWMKGVQSVGAFSIFLLCQWFMGSGALVSGA